MIRLLHWLILPFLLKRARKYGKLTFQHVELPEGLGWHCQLRAPAGENGPGYAWTSTGRTLSAALSGALSEAKEYPIGGRPELEWKPKIGGREFDPEPFE